MSRGKKHLRIKIGKETTKKELIYDNKYLLKSDDDDDEDEKQQIKKEVQDILKGIYAKSGDNKKKLTPEEEDLNNEEIRKRIEEKFLQSFYKKRKFLKRRKKKNLLHTPQKNEQGILLDEEMDIEIYMRRQKIFERDEFYELIKQLKDKNLEWRINYFFDRVKEWKNPKKDDFVKEMDRYIEFDMKDFKLKEDKEARIKKFILGLNDYRVSRKVQRKLFNTFIFKQPLLIENYTTEKHNKSWNLEDKNKDKKRIKINNKSSKSLK